MAISLNNQTGVSNMLTFTDVPNILKITGGGGGGHCVFTFTKFGGRIKTEKQK